MATSKICKDLSAINEAKIVIDFISNLIISPVINLSSSPETCRNSN